MTISRASTSLISFCLLTFCLCSQLCPAGNTDTVIPEPDTAGVQEETADLIKAAYDDVKKNPEKSEKVGDYGMLLLRNSKLNAAGKCFDQVIKTQPNEMRWYYYRGIIHEQLLENTQAATMFKKCSLLEPEYAPALIHLGDVVRSENPQQAEKYYLQAQKTSASDARIYYGLGECALLQGQKDKAIEFLKKALDLVPQYGDAHGALARIYKQQGDMINADIHTAAEKKGREPRVVRDPYYIDLMSRGASAEWLMDLANQLVQSHDYDLAEMFIKRAGNDKRFTDESVKLQGLLAYYRMDYKKAADCLSRYLDQIRGDQDNRLIYARSLIQLKRFDDALVQANLVLKARPDDPDVLEFMGYVSNMAHRPEAGVSHLQKAIRLEPKRHAAHISLIVSNIAADNMADALSAYKSALTAFSSIADLDESLLINLLDLSRTSLSAVAGQATLVNRIGPPMIIRFSEVLGRADLAESASRLAMYPITVAGAVERHAKNNEFELAFGAMDRIIDVDEGGHYRNAMSRTVQVLNAVSPTTFHTFLEENTRKAATDVNLANMMAWIRATSAEKTLRDGAEAIRLAEKADNETGHKNPEVLDTLAAAYAETGNFSKAVEIMQKALDNAGSSDFRKDAFKQRLDLYKKQTAYRY